MIVVDTHALLWRRTGDTHLGPATRRTIDRALLEDDLAVSAMTFWEVAMLRDKNRIDFPEDVGLWRRELLSQGIIEIPVSNSTFEANLVSRSCCVTNIEVEPTNYVYGGSSYKRPVTNAIAYG